MKNDTISTKKSRKKQVVEQSTIGIDLGGQWSHYCVLDEVGEIISNYARSKHFDGVPQARIATETGTQSIWVSEHLREFGHEVIVANVQELRAITHNDRTSDRVDAEKLARYARPDPKVLRPIPAPKSRPEYSKASPFQNLRARPIAVPCSWDQTDSKSKGQEVSKLC